MPYSLSYDNLIVLFVSARPPLFRVGMAAISCDQCVLMFSMHHIIADGISVKILIRDFTALYNGDQLEPQSVSYKDYVPWHLSFLNSDGYKNKWSIGFSVMREIFPYSPCRRFQPSLCTHRAGPPDSDGITGGGSAGFTRLCSGKRLQFIHSAAHRVL